MKRALPAIMLIALLIRLSGIGNALFFDEAILADSVAEPGWVNVQYHQRPPATIFLLNLAARLFGMDVWAYRGVVIVFGLLLVGVIFLLGNELYSKKIGYIAAGLMAVSFYPILASLEINDDSILIFLYLWTAYFFMRQERYRNLRDAVLAGIGMVSILLTNYVGGVLFAILFIYQWIRTKSIIQPVRRQLILGVIAMLVYLPFPLYFLWKNPDTFWMTIRYIFVGAARMGIPFSGKLFALLLWATPFLLGLAALALLRREKKDAFPAVWLIMGIVLHLAIFQAGDFSRYFMFIIPPLVLLSARELSRVKLSRRKSMALAVSGTVFFLFFSFLTRVASVQYPHLMQYYITAVKQLDWNFILPYAISHGSWFGVSFIAVILMLLVSAVSWIGAAIRWRYALLAFLAVGIGYNLFLDGEYVLQLNQPDYHAVIREMISLAKDNDLPEPYWATDKGIISMAYDYGQYPSDRQGKLHRYRIYEGNVEQVRNGTVLFVNFNQKVQMEQIPCLPVKRFYSHGKEAGAVLRCPSP